MNLSSTAFLRISALILVGVGAYGIYSWQMKTEKVREITPSFPSPWYFYAIPLFVLIVFGWAILAKHPFKSAGNKLFLTFALFCGVAYFGVKTFDALPQISWPSYRSEPPVYTPQPSGRPVANEPRQNYQPSQPAPAPPPQQPVREEPPPQPQLSYEQCWQIAHRAYGDSSVAVPPECQQAWSDYKQRQEEIAQERRRRDEEERERIARAERERREEEERQSRIAEARRLENERAVREMEEKERLRREEQARRIRETAEGIKRIFKKN